MKYVLGIKYGGHDSSAALLVNGKLVAACAQERYTRDKHSKLFPTEAINDCLKAAGIKINQIQELAFVNDLKMMIRELYLKTALKNDDRLNFLLNDIHRIEEWQNMDKIIRAKLGYKGTIKYYRHHLCHVASSYFPSGFKNALCLSIDGVGEFETGIIASGKSGKIEILNNDNVYPNSLGLLYSAITHYLGWKHHCDEGIIMGLAPYGNSRSKIIRKNLTTLS